MSHVDIAQEIQNQIGRKALFMLGAKDIFAVQKGLDHDAPGLRFKIRGSKQCNLIEVLLDPSDTYTVVFIQFRGLKHKTVAKVSDVYVDSLHTVIESNTGLYTSL